MKMFELFGRLVGHDNFLENVSISFYNTSRTREERTGEEIRGRGN